MLKRSLLLTLASLMVASSAWAQATGPATPIYHIPRHQDSANIVSRSASSAGSVTLTPNNGETVQISMITITSIAGVAVTGAAPTTITTTFCGGLTFSVASAGTAGMAGQVSVIPFPNGWLCQGGSVPVFTLPTFATNQVIELTIYWRSVQ